MQSPGSADTQPGEGRSAPIRLWLVDDNNRLRDTLAELLTFESGIQCTGSFPSATAALSALASKSGPDVILLDIHMGEENGLDALRPIKLLSRSTRVFMFTTFFDGKSAARALEAGASGFLLKRYPVDRIINSIRRPDDPDRIPQVRSKRHAGTEETIEDDDRSSGRCSPLEPVSSQIQQDADIPKRSLFLQRLLLQSLKRFWN